MELNDDTIELIKSDKFNENFWFFELGRQSISKDNDTDNHFMFSFYDNGKMIWNKYEDRIKEALCDSSKGEPKESVKEFLEGEYRALIEGLLTILVTTLEVLAAVAIPIIALVLKKGINGFCKK